MAKYRRDRVNDAVALEMVSILRNVKDPRVSGAFISVTGADVTPDFKYAKIYYSVLGIDDDPEEAKEIAKGLKSAQGFIRSQLAKTLNLRVTPELTFIPDESMKRGVEIAAMINNLEFADEEEEIDE
ncbi:MAG: 30S ribosome-binding factor RbfA [Ruminococcaceae bacterium]|nr:30S ribosome-binding factor RbfA [Oscillospiraceae bacterium]